MNYKDKSTVIESEFYERLSLISGYSKTTVRDVFKAAYELVEDELKEGTPVVVGKLGSIMRHERNVGGGYNFRTGEKHYGCKTIPVVKFVPARSLQRAVKLSNLNDSSESTNGD